MTDEKLIELINDEIDGFNSPSQSETFNREIAANPDSQALFENLKSLSHILNQVDEVEPPESLKHTIMNSIPRYKYAASDRNGWFKRLIILSKSMFAPRYALSFATGTIAGLLLLGLYTGSFSGKELDPTALTGSIGATSEIVAIEKVDQADFTFTNVSGFVALSTSRSRVRARVSLVGEGEVVVALSFNADELRFAEISKAADSPSRIELGQDKVLLVLSGPGEHTVALDRLTTKDSSIRLKIEAEGEIFEKVMSTVAK